MRRPDSRNLITDVDGVGVGNADHHAIWTGLTVILSDVPAIAAVDARSRAQ
jgi:L-aminopeptidase/D-esterase-like protein